LPLNNVLGARVADQGDMQLTGGFTPSFGDVVDGDVDGFFLLKWQGGK
jgi:hypothetical protein